MYLNQDFIENRNKQKQVQNIRGNVCLFFLCVSNLMFALFSLKKKKENNST